MQIFNAFLYFCRLRQPRLPLLALMEKLGLSNNPTAQSAAGPAAMENHQITSALYIVDYPRLGEKAQGG